MSEKERKEAGWFIRLGRLKVGKRKSRMDGFGYRGLPGALEVSWEGDADESGRKSPLWSLQFGVNCDYVGRPIGGDADRLRVFVKTPWMPFWRDFFVPDVVGMVFGERTVSWVVSKHDAEIRLSPDESVAYYEPMPVEVLVAEITARRARWPLVWSRRREVLVYINRFNVDHERTYRVFQRMAKASTVTDAVLEIASLVSTSEEPACVRVREGAAKDHDPRGCPWEIIED